jgi:putative selenium metabolism protein SsnA
MQQEALIMLIKNAKLITWGENNQVLEDQALYIENGVIGAFGPQEEMLEGYPDAEQIDARGQYVMPGNICAHTHFYGAYARGMGIPGDAPKDFPEILQKLWWPLDMALDEDSVRASAQVLIIDAIKNGTTTLFDHHASPNFIAGSLDVIAEVVDQAGVRAALCYEVTDRNGEEGALAGIQENVRFLESEWVTEHPRLAGLFGLHASLTLSEETLNKCREAVGEDVGFHVHVAEHQADEYDSLNRSGTRVVDRLAEHNLLGPGSIVAHAVHIDMQEALLLADTGTVVTHQPRSNMNNAVGVAPIEDFLRLGIPVGIGTDGFLHAMWEEWKTAYLLHKVWHRDPRRMNGMDLVRMGVENNAALAETYFPGGALGVIEPGARADLIFVDYHPHTPLTADNLPWQILFGFQEGMVTTTMVDGKILMRDRELLTLDEEALTTQARELAPEVWKRYETYVGRYS